jgi:hypothetical protein
MRLWLRGRFDINELTHDFSPCDADKLRLVINETHGGVMSYALPGGKYTDDPKLLAAARVWFLDIGRPSNELQYCMSGGKRHSVRRYTFERSTSSSARHKRSTAAILLASAYQ